MAEPGVERRVVALPDGRQLETEVSGPAGGDVLLFHHGTPGSVHQRAGMRRAVHARGLRLATYSRAGYGASTRHPGRTVADVVADVVVWMHQLGVERFYTAGASGGGPHALATGALLPDRVLGVLCIAGVGPYGAADLDFLAGMGADNVEEFERTLAGEASLRAYLEAAAPGLRAATPDAVVEQLSSLLPPADRAVLTSEVGVDIVASFAEGLARSVDGWLDDDLTFTRDWGFVFPDLTVPVFVWQGTEDLMVPAAHGEWLGRHVPGATVHVEPGEGHLSIGIGAIDRMLDELLSARP